MEKTVKIFNNECFSTYRTTAVLISEKFSRYSYDNILTVYSHKNTLLDLLTDNRYLTVLMNEHGYEITKDWNRGDLIIIKIYIHTFDEPFKVEGEEF
jgi:hypothetical protein